MVGHTTTARHLTNVTLRTDPEVKDKIGDHWSLQHDNGAWNAFTGLSMIAFSATRVGSQLLMVVSLLRKNSADPIFLAACIVMPLVNYLVENSGIYGLWNKRESCRCMLRIWTLMHLDSLRVVLY